MSRDNSSRADRAHLIYHAKPTQETPPNILYPDLIRPYNFRGRDTIQITQEFDPHKIKRMRILVFWDMMAPFGAEVGQENVNVNVNASKQASARSLFRSRLSPPERRRTP